MRKTLLVVSIVSIVFLWVISTPAFGQNRVGVGVGTGKMEVDEELLPGKRYSLPPLVVFNTGDVSSFYEVVVEYSERESGLRPDKNWFTFTPQTFFLEPGGQQTVSIRLTMPLRGTQPEDYFALIVAQPVDEVSDDQEVDGSTEDDDGANESTPRTGATVGVAAGSRLYFTVAPANFLQALYYRLLDFYNENKPCCLILIIIIVLLILRGIFKKYFKIERKEKVEKRKVTSRRKKVESREMAKIRRRLERMEMMEKRKKVGKKDNKTNKKGNKKKKDK